VLCPSRSLREPAVACAVPGCLQDEDDEKAMARLFAEMGEAYVDLIASGELPGSTQTWSRLLLCL